MAKFDSFLTELDSYSVVELNDLVKAIEEKFGVSAAQVSAAPVAGATAEVADEKSTFTVELTSAGEQKIVDDARSSSFFDSSINPRNFIRFMSCFIA